MSSYSTAGGHLFYRAEYPSYAPDPVNLAWFDFNDDEEENQDMLLFIHSVLGGPDRMGGLYRRTTDGDN